MMQTPTNIYRFVRCNKKLFSQLKNISKCHRTYLSKAYQCEEEWAKRLESSLLKKISPSEMFFDIDKKFHAVGRVGAVDIDIFANIINNESNADEIITLLEKLRLTTETSNTLPSTHHAVIRFFLNMKKYNELWEILDNRTKYGIFPDAVCYNLMMDTFLEEKNFAFAAKIASLLMLQEDTDNPISTAMALYSCHRYLEKPDDWKAPVVVKDEPEDDVKVRVKYIRLPYFDDHFDLTEPSDLVGKSLAFFGKHVGDVEGRSCQLRGLILYKKYNKVNQLMEKWIQDKLENVVYKEVLSLIEKDVAEVLKDDANEDIKKMKTLMNKLSGLKLKDGSLSDVLENNIKTAIAKQEKIDMDKQCEDYINWETKRMQVLEDHLTELNKQDKKAEFAKLQEQLEEKEMLLTFFDKEEEIEMEIEDKQKKYDKKYGRIKKESIATTEEYVPPEVKARREIN